MATKDKHGLAVVFGMGRPEGHDMSGGEDEHDDAKSMLEDALKDAGIDEDAVSNITEALHNYVLACVHKPMAGIHSEPDEDDEEEPEGY